MSSLRDGTLGGPPRRSRAQPVLLAVQGALSVALLVGAGLFARSLYNAETFDIGLERDDTLIAQIDFSGTGRGKENELEFFERALDRVSVLPGVQQAALAVAAPLRTMFGGSSLRVPGLAEIPSLPTGGPYVNYVTPEFFAATGMRLLEGRTFLEQERRTSHAIVVDQTMAQLYWPGRSPIGECVSVSGEEGCTSVVGVVADSHNFRIEENEPRLYYYRPLPLPGPGSPFNGSRVLLVRQAPGVGRVDNAIRQTLRDLDSGLPFVKIEPLGEVLNSEIRPWRLGTSVFTAFGILATLLAMVGLWSSVVYAVSQRTREFAIRKAVGAGGGSLIGLTLKAGVRHSAIAVAAGLVIAGSASPLIADLLFEVKPHDSLVFAAVAGGVFSVATLAALPAAWRAARVQPAVALRAD